MVVALLPPGDGGGGAVSGRVSGGGVGGCGSGSSLGKGSGSCGSDVCVQLSLQSTHSWILQSL